MDINLAYNNIAIEIENNIGRGVYKTFDAIAVMQASLIALQELIRRSEALEKENRALRKDFKG